MRMTKTREIFPRSFGFHHLIWNILYNAIKNICQNKWRYWNKDWATKQVINITFNYDNKYAMIIMHLSIEEVTPRIMTIQYES